MKRRRCKNKNCICLFPVSARHPDQKYCSRKECQNTRKAQWQRNKIATDEAYKKNKEDSQQRWLAKNPWYWKEYRENNPDYTKQNREKQKKRDQSKRASTADASNLKHLAKMDASNAKNHIISGVYMIVPVNDDNLAKMDASTAKIVKISSVYS